MVFTIATVGITRMLRHSIQNNTHQIDTQLNKLTYQYIHGQLTVPNTLEIGMWNIEIKKRIENNNTYIAFTARNTATNKVRTKKIPE